MTSTQKRIEDLYYRAIKIYEKLKPTLTEQQRHSLEFELELIKFEINHPGKSYYINQNMRPVKGIMKSSFCKLCGKDLEEIRKNNPRRRIIDFCSTNCRKEHNRRKKIRENEKVDLIMWPTYKGKEKPPRNEMKLIQNKRDEEYKETQFEAKKRKTKKNYYQ